MNPERAEGSGQPPSGDRVTRLPIGAAPSAKTARSVFLPGGGELEIFHRYLVEERLVLALRQRP